MSDCGRGELVQRQELSQGRHSQRGVGELTKAPQVVNAPRVPSGTVLKQQQNTICLRRAAV